LGKVVADGESYPFDAEYYVTESSATIAPVLMKFLYETIDNDLEIAMAGVPSGAVSASLKGSNGKIQSKGKDLCTISGLKVSSEPVVVVLTGTVGGRSISDSKEFKIRSLPDPQTFISFKDADGRPRKFTGGPFSKRALIEATSIEAAIDDGALNIPYTVTGFTLQITDNRGNSIPYVSTSGAFTQQQKDMIKDMPSKRRFYITGVTVLDPAGKPMPLKYVMEVIVN
jgi:gliding motility-associated protein GldM